MQIVSLGDNLHEMTRSVLLEKENKKNKSKCRVLKFLPSLLGVNIMHAYSLGLGGSVGCASDWRPGGRRFDPRRGRQHSFVEIDHEIFSTVILSLR